MILAIVCMTIGAVMIKAYQGLFPTDEEILVRNIRRSIRSKAKDDTGRVDPAEAFGILCDIQDKLERWRG